MKILGNNFCIPKKHLTFFLILLLITALLLGANNIIKSRPTIRAKAETVQPIIGGHPVELGEWPFTAFIWHWVIGGLTSAACTGTLISPKWILTAKHCVSDGNMKYPIRPDYVFVTLNLHFLKDYKNKKNNNLIFPEVKSVVLYEPQQIANVTSECHKGLLCEFDINDIALLELKAPVSLPYVSLIDSTNYKSILKKYGLILGWGKLDLAAKESPDVLQEGKVLVLDFPTNRITLDHPEYYRTFLSSFYNDTTVAANHGDSGGPLLFYNGQKYFLIGITMGADFISDVTNNWNAYKNVYEYLPWIQEKTGIKPNQGSFIGKPPDWITTSITPKMSLTPTPVNRNIY